jgi:hypothetical protein
MSSHHIRFGCANGNERLFVARLSKPGIAAEK